VKRRYEGKLSQEAKREVLATMKKIESLQYTLSVLRELHGPAVLYPSNAQCRAYPSLSQSPSQTREDEERKRQKEKNKKFENF
jgi:hypothetical protein